MYTHILPQKLLFNGIYLHPDAAFELFKQCDAPTLRNLSLSCSGLYQLLNTDISERSCFWNTPEGNKKKADYLEIMDTHAQDDLLFANSSNIGHKNSKLLFFKAAVSLYLLGTVCVGLLIGTFWAALECFELVKYYLANTQHPLT